MQEIRRNILWFEWLYQVSNFGRIKSLFYRKKRKESLLKIQKDKDWYNIIWIYKDWKHYTFRICRIKAQAFIINKKNLPQINHRDWNRSNDGYNMDWKDNLERLSYSDNQKHSYRELWRRIMIGKENPFSKITNQYDLEWNFIKSWWSIMDIQRSLQIANQSISKCCLWKRKSCWGFIRKHI